MKAVIVNGSPRKNWNTDKALKSAAEGLRSQGFETEEVRLYDIEYKGCIECLACKLKNSKTNGLCAYKDALTPILEKCREADVVIVGAPVFYNEAPGQVRSFIERWLFPIGTYMWKDGMQIVVRDKEVPTGLIYTMNCPEDVMEKWNYPILLSDTAKTMKQIMGYNELLYICNTYQFRDYSKYDFNLFDEEDKRRYRDEHFETDLKNAYEMGVSLAKRAGQAIEKRCRIRLGLEGHLVHLLKEKSARSVANEVPMLRRSLKVIGKGAKDMGDKDMYRLMESFSGLSKRSLDTHVGTVRGTCASPWEECRDMPRSGSYIDPNGRSAPHSRIGSLLTIRTSLHLV